ncbi:MAG: 3-hydroxyacyl-CoA dehydrogenase NAD-binding domain-containing protein [Syntrophales bacterium]|jgi:3-hydroxyacyl-CoA dehydrogenase/enoyl-CoA hydratase/carnithine racemase
MSKIFNLRIEDGIGVVTFNVIGDTMNTWTNEAYADFIDLMGELGKAAGLKGVIFISGKPENFLSGANLKVIAEIGNRNEAKEILDTFHGCLNRLSALPYPSLAAIHGHCLGGGLEFTLACTARMAREGKNTIIGLPECNVGLYPGGGGTQRLPRLIGYGAIELILKGTMLPAARALEKGIIDRLVPPEADLLKEAKTFLQLMIDDKAELKRPTHDFSQIDDIAEMAKAGILKATRGREIPGPMLALATMRDGLKVSLEKGLEIEKANFLEVVMSKEAKGGINTFFIKTMTDKPKLMMSRGFIPRPTNKAAILGFGTMGRGIAIDILRNTQIPVIVKDIPEALEPGKAFLKKILNGMAEKKRLKEPVDSLMSRLSVTSEYTDAFKEVDIVIEAVFEEISVKSAVYGELCKVVKEDCVLASNTSSIPITSMAKYVLKPERFGGLHFFSPVWLMQLVEVIRGEQTSQETIDNLLNFSALIRKRPIVCRDNPGFVVNAMLFPNLSTSLQYIEEGNPIGKVDGAMTKFGMPVGPIRLLDEVGIDVPYKAFTGMGVKQETLKNVVEAGRLGLKKSGKGFFLKDGSVDPEVLPLIAKKPQNILTEEQIQNGLLEAMVKVGKDLLDRKIVDDVRMIDVGMIWGTGFPPDKGGPMKWADLTGLSIKLFGKNFY